MMLMNSHCFLLSPDSVSYWGSYFKYKKSWMCAWVLVPLQCAAAVCAWAWVLVPLQGAAAVRLRAYVLVPLQCAAALRAWEVGCWCCRRVPLLCALGSWCCYRAPLLCCKLGKRCLCTLWSMGAGAAVGCHCCTAHKIFC